MEKFCRGEVKATDSIPNLSQAQATRTAGNSGSPGAFLFQQLPGNLQCELNLPVGNLSGVDLPKAGNGIPRRIDRLKIVHRGSEVRVIQDVEEFRPELDGESLRDFWKLSVLDDGEIEVHQAWSDDGVAPEISQKVDAGRSSKTLVTVGTVESRARRLGVDQARRIYVLQTAMTSGRRKCQLATGNAIGNGDGLGIELSHGVALDSIERPERYSGTRL